MSLLLRTELQDALQQHVLPRLPLTALCRLSATCKSLQSSVCNLPDSTLQAAAQQLPYPVPANLTRDQAIALLGRYESAQTSIRKGLFEQREAILLHTECVADTQPSYSPDGSYLAFDVQTPGHKILVKALKGSNIRPRKAPIRAVIGVPKHSVHAWLDNTRLRVAWQIQGNRPQSAGLS